MSRAPEGKPHGAQVKVALRPEYLFLKPAPDGDDGTEVRGQVKTSAYLGERSHIYVNIEVLKHRSPSAR